MKKIESLKHAMITRNVNLQALEIYASVAENKSFTAASRALRVSVATVSKQVKSLEYALGAKLLHRSTHGLSLTNEGLAFHVRCIRILADIEDAKHELTRTSSEIEGKLRLHSTLDIGQHVVAPALVEFAARYPGLSIELVMGPTPIKIIENRLDIAFRTHERTPVAEQSIEQRNIGPIRYLVCAAPEYLERAGKPSSPAELEAFNCIVQTTQSDIWKFCGANGDFTVRVSGTFAANNSMTACEAAQRGLGIARLPDYVVRKAISEGRLVVLFDGQAVSDRIVRACYPRAFRVPAKIELLIASVEAQLKGESI